MKMVDVSTKFETIRTAQAEGKIYLSKETVEMIKNEQIPKGDVLVASQMAGIMGVKKTPEVLPFCHPILIDQAFVETRLDEDGVYVRSYVRCIGRTGVEMEALSAVSVALLNVYDMCKAFDKNMVISEIRLLSKTGGKSEYEEDLSGLTCGVITLSDSCYMGQGEDSSGKVAIEIIENEFNGKVVEYHILPDEEEIIVEKLKSLVDRVDIIITTGGTGFSKRDVTPEATLKVVDREMVGFEEAMRVLGVKFTPKSLLSRGVCGIAGDHTLIVNLPGSARGVRDNLRMIAPLLKHAIKIARGEKKY